MFLIDPLIGCYESPVSSTFWIYFGMFMASSLFIDEMVFMHSRILDILLKKGDLMFKQPIALGIVFLALNSSILLTLMLTASRLSLPDYNSSFSLST